MQNNFYEVVYFISVVDRLLFYLSIIFYFLLSCANNMANSLKSTVVTVIIFPRKIFKLHPLFV